MLYVFKEIQNGNATLDEEKVYESRFWREGSGAYQIQLLTSYANEVIDEYDEFVKDQKIHEKERQYDLENKYLIR